MQSLSEYDRKRLIEQESNASFTFGSGPSEKSLKKLSLPCYIGGQRCKIETDVVRCNIPLLLSKPSMKKAKMCLDFGSDRAKFGNCDVNLSCSSSGHYLLPLSL